LIASSRIFVFDLISEIFDDSATFVVSNTFCASELSTFFAFADSINVFNSCFLASKFCFT
jgi:hypothetical protein